MQTWISSERINLGASHSEQCCSGRRMDQLNFPFQLSSGCAQGLWPQRASGFSPWHKEWPLFCFWRYQRKGLLKVNIIQVEFELNRQRSWFLTPPPCGVCSFFKIIPLQYRPNFLSALPADHWSCLMAGFKCCIACWTQIWLSAV